MRRVFDAAMTALLAVTLGAGVASAQAMFAPRTTSGMSARSNDRALPGEIAPILVRGRRADADAARVPSIAPITLGVPTISAPGPSTFSACPDGRDSLGVPGVDCRR